MKPMTDYIDALTKRVSDLCAEIDEAAALAKTKRRYVFEHDDDDDGSDGGIDASDPSAVDDAENSDDADDDSELEDGEDEDDGELEKATINAAVMRNDRAQRPGTLKESTHTAPRHKFEALVSKIVNEHGIPASQAQAYVRTNYPQIYESYQAFSTAKRAPDLVEIEMAKGCSREVAAQRVAQLHGFRAFDQSTSIRKRADLTYTFQSRVDEIMRKDRVDACEATRRARQEDPHLFLEMQRTG
jgi:hypothetical protein